MNPSSGLLPEAFTPGEATLLLIEVRAGDQSALNKLLPLVYDELRKIASSCLSLEHSHRTIQTSDRVHEAYLRLADADISWQNRAHFFGIAARSMRQILVDYARSRNGEKRGGGYRRGREYVLAYVFPKAWSRCTPCENSGRQ